MPNSGLNFIDIIPKNLDYQTARAIIEFLKNGVSVHGVVSNIGLMKMFDVYQYNKKRDAYVPYSKSGSKRVKYRKTHSQIYSDIRGHPDIYLEEALSDTNSPLSLDEITLRLQRLTGILIRNKTLLKIVKRYEFKHGVALLKEIKCRDRPVYRMF